MKTQDFLNEIEQIEKLSVEEQKNFYKTWLQEKDEKTENSVLVRFNYAKLFYQSGDFRKAIEILEPILLDYQSYPYTSNIISCFNLMGVATHCEAEYSVSRYYYRLALKIVQENKAQFYYSFEYNNIALTYIAQKNYENAMEYIELAEKFLEYSDEEMGAYIYINKTNLFQKMNRMEEALRAYEIGINQYHAYEFLPDDTMLSAATLFYKLGQKDKYEKCKSQILSKVNDMYAAEFMDACRELFECSLDSGDTELIEKILESMDRYIQEHPQEIKVGITVADLKYIYACKLQDKEAILQALELKNYFKDQIIAYSENKRVQSLHESMEINTQLQKAIESKDQAVRAKSQFLANMSHDIRTPINGIMGMLNIIRKTKGDADRLEDCLYKIEVSSKLLLSLVNDVLDMSKLETNALVLDQESINLEKVCSEATNAVIFQAEEAGISVSVEHDDLDGINVLGNALYLKKILINLFGNCTKYNKPGGSIHTRMKILEHTKECIICEFYIEDTGVGMSQDFIENKLFEPFMQADTSSRSSYVGTGLGMSIVKQLVEKMDGTIKVESQLGVGSRFTVVIPFKIDQQTDVEEAENALNNIDMTGMCFLVAEDNDLNMEIIDFLLTEEGAKVIHAKNGREALRKFEMSSVGDIDMILMDLMMPVMDGLTATKAIRSLKHPDAKKIPIVAMTANAFAEDAQKCIEAGMNAHLAKPLDVPELMKTIKEFCKR